MSGNKKKYELNSVAVIGNYLPRLCGIATFTTDLCNALSEELRNQGEILALAMDDIVGGYTYPDRVKFQLRANVQSDYLRAADFINVNQFDVVILQHEFGIFGGKQGAHILHLLKSLRMPVLTTLHTALTEPSDEHRVIIRELARYSERLVVMSDKARNILHDTFGIPDSQITFIPHGIPDVAFVDPSFHKDQFGVEDRKVILSFGLLSPGKGIEHAINALPKIVSKHPDVAYIILGATHPHVKRDSGEEYRNGLYRLVNELGLNDNVIFVNRFVAMEELCEYLGAADIYVTPYLNEAQITSGTLVYASPTESEPLTAALVLIVYGNQTTFEFGEEATDRDFYTLFLAFDADIATDDRVTVDTCVLDADLVGAVLIVKGFDRDSRNARKAAVCELAV